MMSIHRTALAKNQRHKIEEYRETNLLHSHINRMRTQSTRISKKAYKIIFKVHFTGIDIQGSE